MVPPPTAGNRETGIRKIGKRFEGKAGTRKKMILGMCVRINTGKPLP